MAESPVRVEIDGADQLASSLKRLAVDVEDFSAINRRTGTYVAAKGANRAPKRTGRLAASGRGEPSNQAAVIRFGGSAIRYAGPIHWGTGARPGRRGPHNIRPSLFALKAAQDSESTWRGWYADDLTDKVDRVKGA